MAEEWYVPVVVEFEEFPELGEGVKAHVFHAGVPDDVYAIPSAWDQEEIGFGLWKLRFRPGVTLTADQKARMIAMGCKPVVEGQPAARTSLSKRATALSVLTALDK